MILFLLRAVVGFLRRRLTPSTKQIIQHVAIVFLVAFGAQLGAGFVGVVSVPAILAVLTSAGAAGLAAVYHYIAGLLPAPTYTRTGRYSLAVHVPPVVERRAWQVAVSIVGTFVAILGTAALGGAVGVTSWPAGVDIVVAALSAAVTGVVQFAIGLVPAPATPLAPEPPPTPTPVPVAPVAPAAAPRPRRQVPTKGRVAAAA